MTGFESNRAGTQAVKGKTAMASRIACGFAALAMLCMASSAPAVAQFRQHVGNDMAQCGNGAGPAVLITVADVKESSGTVRVQSYRGTAADWLKKGRWLSRIEVPARRGTMTFCVPVPAAGTYGIAVRHDVNGNGKTDLRQDGGGMSNNPGINLFNLGRPSYTKTAISVGDGVRAIRILMKYM